MDEYELEKRINAANNMMIGDEPGVESLPQPEEEQTPLPTPVDYYQQNIDKRQNIMTKPVLRGASTLTKKIAKEVLEDLVKFKRRADADVEYWKNLGDKERPQMVRDQYIEDHFLPSVEMLIMSTTPDEVLNAKDILKEFDDLSMQYGPGYTASYIRTAYGDQLGNASAASDGYVVDAVERIRGLAANNQIRAAYGMAKKLKDDIDKGEHTASDEDYELITRVATIQ